MVAGANAYVEAFTGFPEIARKLLRYGTDAYVARASRALAEVAELVARVERDQTSIEAEAPGVSVRALEPIHDWLSGADGVAEKLRLTVDALTPDTLERDAFYDNAESPERLAAVRGRVDARSLIFSGLDGLLGQVNVELEQPKARLAQACDAGRQEACAARSALAEITNGLARARDALKDPLWSLVNANQQRDVYWLAQQHALNNEHVLNFMYKYPKGAVAGWRLNCLDSSFQTAMNGVLLRLQASQASWNRVVTAEPDDDAKFAELAEALRLDIVALWETRAARDLVVEDCAGRR
ncbi:MAG: hypothetical protein HY553_12910 [Elusimicrobia bacterium]|nr:hypothetical protein [Elusimicrobiota bacterium]